MIDLIVNPFGNPQVSWPTALLRAAVVEGVLFVFLLLGYLNLIPAFRGADNALWFYFAGLLQFPSSLLFVPLSRPTVQLVPGLVVSGFGFAAAVVVVLQFLLMAVLIRKPWRRT